VHGAIVGTVLAATLAVSATADSRSQFTGHMMPYLAFDKLRSEDIVLDGSRLRVAVAPGEMRTDKAVLRDWVERSGRAIAVYYGKFPVKLARVLLVPDDGNETSGGQAFGNAGAAIRIRVGTHATANDLKRDWQLPHEMAHLAFPQLEGDPWLSEGMAVYVEPIARVQSGDLDAEQIWAEFTNMMPSGLPDTGAKGMADTEKRERVYWGGAMFWLVADLEIRKRTDNRIGVQSALRAVLDAGGTIESVWSAQKALAIADRATGHDVLSAMYEVWREKPQSPDLDKIWSDLGIVRSGNRVRFDDSAPLAKVRRAITAKLASQ
jgi:hypothetical protein